ncbi:hypothetical protein FN846DRAFT_913647 [Sphaerosporella brunnea]|uniref:Uncharacterized protein n=1 Tax=Sphaerosporella brunnea TaxID=1250544 RepID=A0A5J5EFU0_9PEZI|nr:hypothetical protein FN846DRAFT_913647 [Sphaerosporella brunnea]
MVAAQAASPPSSRKRRREEEHTEGAGKTAKSGLMEGVKNAVKKQLHRRSSPALLLQRWVKQKSVNDWDLYGLTDSLHQQEDAMEVNSTETFQAQAEVFQAQGMDAEQQAALDGVDSRCDLPCIHVQEVF